MQATLNLSNASFFGVVTMLQRSPSPQRAWSVRLAWLAAYFLVGYILRAYRATLTAQLSIRPTVLSVSTWDDLRSNRFAVVAGSVTDEIINASSPNPDALVSECSHQLAARQRAFAARLRKMSRRTCRRHAAFTTLQLTSQSGAAILIQVTARSACVTMHVSHHAPPPTLRPCRVCRSRWWGTRCCMPT
jgi:hypothetical protein